MQTISHKKNYLGTEIKDTRMEIILDPKDDLDNIIYYLICAQDKKNAGKKMAYEARVTAGLEKLIKFHKGLK